MQLQSFIQPAVGGQAVVTAFYGVSAPDGAVFPWSTAPLGSLYFQLDNSTPTVVIWQRKGTANTSADWEAFSAATTVEVAHTAVTLGSGSDAALTLSGQELTLTDVLTPTEHTAIGDDSPHHTAVTLDTNADTLLSLSTQEIGLDTQVKNMVLGGPATGADAVPTFRALVSDDVPSLDHGAKLTGLSDDDHTQYLLATGTRTGASGQAQEFTKGVSIDAAKASANNVYLFKVAAQDAFYIYKDSSGYYTVGFGNGDAGNATVFSASDGSGNIDFSTIIGAITLTNYKENGEITLSADDIKLTGGPVDLDSNRITNLANATADTDALNRQTGDGRYMALANEGDYLLADGSRTGATGQAQTFTNGIVGSSWKPASDSTAALQLQNAAGTAVATLDTNNSRFGVGTSSPIGKLHVHVPDLVTDSYIFVSHVSAGTFSAPVWSGLKLLGYANSELGRIDAADQLNDANVAKLRFQVRNDSGTLATSILIDGDGKLGIWTETPKAALDVRGGIALPSKTIAVADSPYTVLITDYTIRCNCVGGAITVALPEATGSGRILNIKKTDSSANAVTVDGYSTNTIDGAATVDIGTQYANMQIQDAAAGVWDIL